MAGGEEACLVCGRLPAKAVQRVLDADSALYTELLLEPALLASLCVVCDRLVGRFEQLSRERGAVREELEGRRDKRMGDVEKGEITDVSSFVKDGVKIFEIDVKSEDVVSKIAEQIRKENTANVKKRSRSLRTTTGPRQKKRRIEDLEDSLDEHQDEEEEDPGAPDPESDHADSVDQSFDCRVCFTSFSSSDRLSGHKRLCTETAGLHCKLCSKHFANKRNLRDHNRVYHDAPPDPLLETKYSYPCKECEKVFYKKSNLTSHMMRHSSDKPYVCGVDNCGKEFKRQKTLMKHIELIHEGKKEELLCVHCGKQFASQSGLRAHVSGHTGVDPVRREVPCPACHKTFRCRADLDSHMVVHSRAKPYACTRCTQAFSQKASLKDHENVHLERFQCGGCGKAFGRERYLKLHCRTCGDQQAGVAGTEVQHIIISGVGAMAGKEGELVQVVQVPESGELAVVHHHGVQLVQEEVEQVVHQLVQVEADHVVALVSSEEQHAFQIVQAENG